MSLPSNFYSGLSGIQLPLPRHQYPEAFRNTSRLQYYATLFNSIEVNSSFYKIPMPSTVSRWASTVNEPFKFTFKLFKDVTHTKELNFDQQHIEHFMKVISHVDLHNGCLLIQLPPSVTNMHLAQLDRMLHVIKELDTKSQWKTAVEFRNRSWYNEDVYDLLTSYDAAMVFQDIPKSAAPIIHTASNFNYVRFHGPTGNYGGSYSEAFLEEYAGYIKEWLNDGKNVFSYFNNTKGDAYNNLVTLNRFVSSN